ncbi:hypothetical protein ACN28S_43750 [Cystobacter fuscus]
MRRSTSWCRASSGDAVRRLVPALLLLAVLGACWHKAQSPEPPRAPRRRPPGRAPPSAPRTPPPPAPCSSSPRTCAATSAPVAAARTCAAASRAAFQVREAGKGPLPVLYVDGGESLFGSPTLKPEQVPQEERKARAIAEVFKDMGLAVRAVSELDNVRGAAFRQGLGLPELPTGGVKVLAAGARKVGVVSASDAAGLQRGDAQARAQGAAFVVGLFQGTLPEAQNAVASAGPGVDLVVATHTASEFDGEQNTLTRSAVPVVGLQSKGRSLLRVDLAYGATPGRFTQQRSGQEAEKEVASLERRMALLDTEINLPGVDPQLKALKQQKRAELVERRRPCSPRPWPPEETATPSPCASSPWSPPCPRTRPPRRW